MSATVDLLDTDFNAFQRHITFIIRVVVSVHWSAAGLSIQKFLDDFLMANGCR